MISRSLERNARFHPSWTTTSKQEKTLCLYGADGTTFGANRFVNISDRDVHLSSLSFQIRLIVQVAKIVLQKKKKKKKKIHLSSGASFQEINSIRISGLLDPLIDRRITCVILDSHRVPTFKFPRISKSIVLSLVGRKTSWNFNVRREAKFRISETFVMESRNNDPRVHSRKSKNNIHKGNVRVDPAQIFVKKSIAVRKGSVRRSLYRGCLFARVGSRSKLTAQSSLSAEEYHFYG